MIADRAKKVTVGAVSGGSVGLPETRTFFFCLIKALHVFLDLHYLFNSTQGMNPVIILTNYDFISV